MSCNAAHVFMIGMMLWIAPALTGCVASEGEDFEEPRDGHVGSDGEVRNGDISSEALDNGEAAEQEIAEDSLLVAIGIENVTCRSGWPGTRGCHWTFSSPTDIIAGTVSAVIHGRNGELGHTVSTSGLRTVEFTASVREGDAFDPGKNSTSYTVFWLQN